jgi:uncharacterized protein
MFNSPTYGQVTLEEVRSYILLYLKEEKEEQYRLIVGTDSQQHPQYGVDFVTAIIIHRKGRGGIYFWRRIEQHKSYVLRQRMYEEAYMSLQMAEQLLVIFENYRISRYNIEIHVDIGQSGDTREMISEIVGMIRGSGYEVKTKPESYGASKVADRYT